MKEKPNTLNRILFHPFINHTLLLLLFFVNMVYNKCDSFVDNMCHSLVWYCIMASNLVE